MLPVIKATPKKLLPVADKPLVRYATEEAIAAGIETLIFVTGRNRRAIGDQFDVNNESETMLCAKGKDVQGDIDRNIITEGVACISVLQVEQKVRPRGFLYGTCSGQRSFTVLGQ